MYIYTLTYIRRIGYGKTQLAIIIEVAKAPNTCRAFPSLFRGTFLFYMHVSKFRTSLVILTFIRVLSEEYFQGLMPCLLFTVWPWVFGYFFPFPLCGCRCYGLNSIKYHSTATNLERISLCWVILYRGDEKKFRVRDKLHLHHITLIRFSKQRGYENKSLIRVLECCIYP